MHNTSWDVVVIGGGPAGLSAALLLGRARRRTLVIDSGEPRNRFASHMHGLLGNEGVSPHELSATGRREAAAYGVESIEGTVDRVNEVEGGLSIALSDGSELSARALIIATGITDVLPDIPGLAAHWGTGVLHCPYCHGWEVSDQRLGVLATSPAALHQAHLVRQWSDDVTVFTAGLGELDDATAARLRSRGVTLIDSPVVEVLGTPGELSGVRTADGATVVLDAVFSAGAPRPHDHFVTHLSLARTDIIGSSFIEVDFAGATSHARIWATGNVVNPMLTVPMSIGAGAMTGGAVNGALVTEDFDLAEKLATPEGFWQARYSEEGRVWSGHANAVLTDVVAGLEAGSVTADGAASASFGSALDLGCGEGGDVLWLAQRGWTATGVDISRNAVERAESAARTASIPSERIRFIAADLSEFETAETFDLVTASFLQSPVELARGEILRKAATMVGSGGRLLITAHGSAPRPSGGHSKPGPHSGPSSFPAPEDDLASLELDTTQWEVEVCEKRPRTVMMPGREPYMTQDSVVLVRRL